MNVAPLFLRETLTRAASNIDGGQSSIFRYARVTALTGMPVLLGLAITAIAVRGRLRLADQAASQAGNQPVSGDEAVVASNQLVSADPTAACLPHTVPPERPSSAGLVRLLLLWWLIPFGLFSALVTQRDWYVYPSLVPACMLAAWALRAGLAQLERARTRLVGPIVATIVVALGGAESSR